MARRTSTRDRVVMEGQDDLQNALRLLDTALPVHVRDELYELGKAIAELAEPGVPVDTGALRDSGEIDVYNNAVVVRIGKQLEYAIPVHENREHFGAKFLEAPAALLGGHWKAERLNSVKGAKARRLAARRFERLTTDW